MTQFALNHFSESYNKMKNAKQKNIRNAGRYRKITRFVLAITQKNIIQVVTKCSFNERHRFAHGHVSTNNLGGQKCPYPIFEKTRSHYLWSEVESYLCALPEDTSRWWLGSLC